MCQVEYVGVYVCVHYMDTGFSWLLNTIPAADTPRASYGEGCVASSLCFDNNFSSHSLL